MAKLNKDMYLKDIPPTIYKELIYELNENSNWKILASHLAEQLGYECNSWLQSLQKDITGTRTSAENLLFELNIKMCTVEILCTLLKDCELINVLSILHFPEPLIIIRHPSDDMKCSILEISFGQHLHLSCKAFGIPIPHYIWCHNDNEMPGQHHHELDIIVNSASQAGEYKCKVLQKTDDGTVTSVLLTKSVFVNIFPMPIVIQQQPLPLLEIKEDEDFTISCIARGYPEPCYQWFRDNTKLEGKTSNVLHIREFSSKYEGKYYCHLTNNISEVFTQRSHIMMDLPRQKAVAKIALIIANCDYENHECLHTPKNDAAKIGILLREIDFKVICLINLTFEQMRNAIKIFGKLLSEGVYGLFYYAGHGFKMQESYMLAVNAPTSYLRKDAICESELLATLMQNDPILLVTILDMCQTVPPKECNPDIHNEVPKIEEYKSTKNLRNLVQAYSTSSHRPSYERVNNKYGLYATHLSKYINKDIPVTKVFEEVGKSIDTWLKGTERNQIPILALNITKPFHLTDAVHRGVTSSIMNHLNKSIAFCTRYLEVNFKQTNISAKVTISLFMEPYLNVIKVSICDLQLEDSEVNFFNSVPTEPNNLFQTVFKQECWIHNPQNCQGPLVISISRKGIPIGATLLHIKNHIPLILESIKS